MSKITEDMEKWVAPFLSEHGMELYYMEYVKEGKDRVLRVVIDRDGGVGSDDCEFVSHYISSELDLRDPIPDSYLLEVSSPGIERELRKDAHFEKSIGKQVRVMLFRTYEGSKSYVGELVSFDEAVIRVRTGEDVIGIPRELVSKVKIVFHFNQEDIWLRQ